MCFAIGCTVRRGNNMGGAEAEGGAEAGEGGYELEHAGSGTSQESDAGETEVIRADVLAAYMSSYE